MEYLTNRKWRAGPLFWCGLGYSCFVARVCGGSVFVCVMSGVLHWFVGLTEHWEPFSVLLSQKTNSNSFIINPNKDEP